MTTSGIAEWRRVFSVEQQLVKSFSCRFRGESPSHRQKAKENSPFCHCVSKTISRFIRDIHRATRRQTKEIINSRLPEFVVAPLEL
jgi:hypothetical protein